MKNLQIVRRFFFAVAISYILATAFYTLRVLDGQTATGASYSFFQAAEVMLANFTGLWAYGLVIAIALTGAFVVADRLTRIRPGLGPILFPLCGGGAFLVFLLAIESLLGGGAGIIGGARTPAGVFLQCLSGVVGGALYYALQLRAREQRV